MNTHFEDAIRTVFSDIAEEALPVDLTRQAIDRADRRRVTKIALGAATVGAAVLIGAPLAMAAGGHSVQPTAPSPSVSSVATPVPSPSASSTQTPVPSPSGSAPVASSSPQCTDLHPAPSSPCFLVPIPSPSR